MVPAVLPLTVVVDAHLSSFCRHEGCPGAQHFIRAAEPRHHATLTRMRWRRMSAFVSVFDEPLPKLHATSPRVLQQTDAQCGRTAHNMYMNEHEHEHEHDMYMLHVTCILNSCRSDPRMGACRVRCFLQAVDIVNVLELDLRRVRGDRL